MQQKSAWKVGILAGIACATAMGAAAQTTDSAQMRSSSSKDRVTITGCVQRADERAVGTSGAGGAGSAGATFILATGSSKSTMSPTGGVNPSSSAATTPSSYRLDADEGKLTPHVGHKVEISGTIDAASTRSSGTTTEPPTTPSSSTPKLKVDSIKMIASTCSE